MLHREFAIYQHDNSDVFRFVLSGQLSGSCVEEFQHAWMTATSVLQGKSLVVDLTDMSEADEAGQQLLAQLRASGAQIIPPAAQAHGTEGVPRRRWRLARLLPISSNANGK